MRNIRIGNDININWTIQRNDSPENFAGKTIIVKLIDSMGNKSPIEYFISGNVINVTFYGKNQRQLGKYILCLVENDGQEDMNTIDKVDVFCLVRHSCDATGQDECPNLTTDVVEFTSSLEFYPINVVQTTGDSEVDVMSQNAVTQAVKNSLKAKLVLDITNNPMIIQHDMGYLPRVLILDDNMHECECKITYLDNNQVQVSWNGDLTGQIFIY